MFEGWGIAAAAVVAVGTVAASTISASAQSSAAKTAAEAQESAAELQANTQASMANAELGIQAPSRELGGMAQNEMAYLMGLSPNLNVSADMSTPVVSPTGTTTWTPNTQLTSQGAAPGSTTGPNMTGNAQTGYAPTTATSGVGGVNAANPTNYSAPAATNGIAQTSGAQIIPSGGGQIPSGVPLNGTGTAQPGVGGAVAGTSSAPTTGGIAGNTNANPAGGATAAPGTTPGGGATNGMGYGSLLTNPMDNPANLTINPDYQFVLGTNESMLNSQMAAGGNSPTSTGTIDAAMNYATGLASTTYQNAFQNATTSNLNTFNELGAMAGQGQTANAAAGASLESGASGISAAQGAYGNAAAAGAIGQGNAISSGIGGAMSGVNQAANMNMLSQNSTYGTAASNPNNLGGSTAVAPSGSNLTYDADGNITGSAASS